MSLIPLLPTETGHSRKPSLLLAVFLAGTGKLARWAATSYSTHLTSHGVKPAMFFPQNQPSSKPFPAPEALNLTG